MKILGEQLFLPIVQLFLTKKFGRKLLSFWPLEGY